MQMKTQQRVRTGKLEQRVEQSFGYLSLGKLAILAITRLSYSLSQIKSGSHKSLHYHHRRLQHQLSCQLELQGALRPQLLGFALQACLTSSFEPSVFRRKGDYSKHYPFQMSNFLTSQILIKKFLVILRQEKTNTLALAFPNVKVLIHQYVEHVRTLALLTHISATGPNMTAVKDGHRVTLTMTSP